MEFLKINMCTWFFLVHHILCDVNLDFRTIPENMTTDDMTAIAILCRQLTESWSHGNAFPFRLSVFSTDLDYAGALDGNRGVQEGYFVEDQKSMVYFRKKMQLPPDSFCREHVSNQYDRVCDTVLANS